MCSIAGHLGQPLPKYLPRKTLADIRMHILNKDQQLQTRPSFIKPFHHTANPKWPLGLSATDPIVSSLTQSTPHSSHPPKTLSNFEGFHLSEVQILQKGHVKEPGFQAF